MGGSKTTKAPPAPAFQGGKVYLGNDLISQTSQEGNDTVTRYNETPAEQQARLFSQQRIAQLLPTLGQTSSNLLADYEKQANTFADQQLQTFNRQYEPALRNLQQDIVGRFGTNRATPFLQGLTEFEQNVRQPALTQIAQQAALLKRDLSNQDEARKYNELQALGVQLSDSQRNFLSGLNPSQNLSAAGNNFAQQNYQTQLAAASRGRSRSFFDKLANPLGF